MCGHRRLEASGVPILGDPVGNCKSFLAVFHDSEARVTRGNPL
jgi:hypothetical protein